jgi:hypothetical protein
MGKNLKRYYQAWKLRQQGKKLHEIAKIMELKSGEWPRCMIAYINYRINNKFIPMSKELRQLINKEYNLFNMKWCKRTFLLFLLFLILSSFTVSARSYRTAPSDVYVNGYYRKNGTYVQPYYRTPPNNTKLDNYDCIDHGNCGGSIQQPVYVAPTSIPYIPPTLVPYPTHIPYPTFKPFPTLEPFPTFKPYPTHVPYPTYTPYSFPTLTQIPTNMLIPTEALTPTLTNTPILKPTQIIKKKVINNIKKTTQKKSFWQWLFNINP